MLTTAELVWLLAAVAKGDQLAFEHLYVATRAKLYGVVLRILQRRDLADQVMEDTYQEVGSTASRFDPARATPVTWMVAIARNRAIDAARRTEGQASPEQPDALEIASDSPEPPAQRVLSDDLKRLLACIGRLEPERQRLVLLAYYDGWSREQLAAQLDMPEDTIRTWLQRSLIEIRECLGS